MFQNIDQYNSNCSDIMFFACNHQTEKTNERMQPNKAFDQIIFKKIIFNLLTKKEVQESYKGFKEFHKVLKGF